MSTTVVEPLNQLSDSTIDGDQKHTVNEPRNPEESTGNLSQ